MNFVANYWGKADEAYPGEPKWHLLAYHSLDVAAVAAAWWDSSPVVRRIFLAAFGYPEAAASRLRAWALFFVALHDIGKFDVRFQLKAMEILAQSWPGLFLDQVDQTLARNFDHGSVGYAWSMRELASWAEDDSDNLRDAWRPWISAVTGHHGDLPASTQTGGEYAGDRVMEHDGAARREFVTELADLLLAPEALSLQDRPPQCSPSGQAWLAGFCSVCDWIGSNVNAFPYRPLEVAFAEYFKARVGDMYAKDWLRHFGLLAQAGAYGGIEELLAKGESARGLQVLMDGLSLVPGFTLIEAPTGSGKTEAALAYAWRLLAAGMADSIVFALPTQATANAMLTRTEAFAQRVFGEANVVLAHGKRDFNEAFKRLADSGQHGTIQGEIEAAIQCSAWLASSRKRVFLGQVGICTVDQVLLSVLPVRHKFVRGFGLNKSVLIVDEVHAYDAYMHGLLGEVLRRQRAAGGSAILLSATLPAGVRSKLLEAWEVEGSGEAPYPALWHATQGAATCLTVPDNQRPARREVETECLKLPGAFPDEPLLGRIVSAAESGALVAVVMNLVDDAQRLARLLRGRTALPVDVFHARYRFMDRQRKEQAVCDHYGRNAQRAGGRILVATQVVEQSLDLDFDWLLTQICPVDLLFQRLGRLHRHQRPRPIGYELPRCAVLSVEAEDYGLHKLIYGNTRVLWRTERLLLGAPRIVFPEAYREWIEQVYQNDERDDEPEIIKRDYQDFTGKQLAAMAEAKRLTTMTVKSFRDEDYAATALTRDGEMSLTVLPIQSEGRLLDGQVLSAITERDLAEMLNRHAAPVPASWEKRLMGCRFENEGSLAGYRQLEMNADGQGGWSAMGGKFRYSEDYGMERGSDESA
ncbi:MAG TPA: CRISPR-associated helicase/endonuclease Cas3 [Terracidiphilus sp.]|nr:CRISPR-associated helicase/endonuclease Cas3 [Terracidiphilus sp.]